MDAPETPSVVGEPPRPSPDDASPMPAPRPRPPNLGALYASPTGPTVLVYYPEHHNLGMPLVPKQLEAAEPRTPVEALLPLRCKFRFTSATGLLIIVIVRLAFSAPLGDGWSTRRIGPVHLSTRIDA
jgi:hypothetical protein